MGMLVQEEADELPQTQDYINLANAFNSEDRRSLEVIQKNNSSMIRTKAPVGQETLEDTIWDSTRFIASHFSLRVLTY